MAYVGPLTMCGLVPAQVLFSKEALSAVAHMSLRCLSLPLVPRAGSIHGVCLASTLCYRRYVFFLFLSLRTPDGVLPTIFLFSENY